MSIFEVVGYCCFGFVCLLESIGGELWGSIDFLNLGEVIGGRNVK